MIRFYTSLRERRRAKTKALVRGSALCPRVSLFRSNKYIYAQLINDQKGETLVAVHSRELKTAAKSRETPKGQRGSKQLTKTERATLVGRALAQKAKRAGIEKVVFDRSGYKYHGRVKALAEAVRKEGLKF
jgi:large subunit ribosomal protein L18